MEQYTKKEAIKIAVQCAKKYRDELEGKNLLFLAMDNHKRITVAEFTFHPQNFLHLTGLKVKKPGQATPSGDSRETIAAKDFYNRCLAHKLSERDFLFADDGTTAMKLDVLPQLVCKNLSAKMLGDFDSSKPKLYTERLVGGQKACMGFLQDRSSGEYIPNTVLKGDIRDIVDGKCIQIIAVFRKEITAPQYAELIYTAKKIQWESVAFPEDYRYLMDMIPAAHKAEDLVTV